MIETLTGSSNSPLEPIETTEPCVIGYRVECDSVFSISHGRIAYVGHGTDGYVQVCVWVNHNELIRYGHLHNVQFDANQDIVPGIKLGDAQKYVVVEYCTSWKGDSKFPVRCYNHTYYKQDPIDILEGRYMPQSTMTMVTSIPKGKVIADYTTDDQRNEFEADNRGILDE